MLSDLYFRNLVLDLMLHFHAHYLGSFVHFISFGQIITLLIADVTRLQPFTVGGDSFRENLETLVSYNVRTDRIQQDCLYIEQGHLMTPTTFMTYSMAVNPHQSVVVTWTPIKMYSTPQGSQPSSRPGSPLYTSS